MRTHSQIGYRNQPQVNAANSVPCTTVTYEKSKGGKDEEQEKSATEAVLDNVSVSAGLTIGISADVELGPLEVGAGLGSLTESYEVTASLEDQGTFEATGPHLTAQLDRLGFDIRTNTITEIFDSDLGPTRSWREVISDGEFIYENRNGELVPIGADTSGAIRIDIKAGIIHAEINIDIFKMIFELTQ